MADKTAGTAAVPAGVEQVAPGVPAVQVDPGNELLDGENLDLKADMFDSEPVHVDETGRRIEHDDEGIPPPQAANLELRQRLLKEQQSVLGSIGKGDAPDEDPMVAALRREREGLQRRADDGDERSGRRVGQVDAEIQRLGGDKDAAEGDDAPEARSEAARKRAAAAKSTGSQSTPPAGRSSKPTSSG